MLLLEEKCGGAKSSHDVRKYSGNIYISNRLAKDRDRRITLMSKAVETPSIDTLLHEITNNFHWQQLAYCLGEAEVPSREDMETLLGLFRKVNETNVETYQKALQILECAKVHDNRINDLTL